MDENKMTLPAEEFDALLEALERPARSVPELARLTRLMQEPTVFED